MIAHHGVAARPHARANERDGQVTATVSDETVMTIKTSIITGSQGFSQERNPCGKNRCDSY
jgi:hypothetical protein